MPIEEVEGAKDLLTKLYINLKFQKNDNVENKEDKKTEEMQHLKKLSLIDLIKFITNFIECLLEIKKMDNELLQDKNEEKPLYKQYEELLIKAEDDIRKHIKVSRLFNLINLQIEQELKIRIEDLEFELDDYRTGKIKGKRRNLSCLNEPRDYCKNGNNYKINNNENVIKSNEKIKIIHSNNILQKPISVNSNNNYLLTKLKKENDNLRLRLSKYECNNNKNKPTENKVKQKKIENAVRITKKIVNNKQLITKSSSNISNFANNTYTNNFYNAKDNKFKNNNSSIYNNFNKNIYNSNEMTTNSFFDYNKKFTNNKIIKSFSVFRSISKDKSKSTKKRIIYDKIKNNFQKIQNKLSKSNFMENNNKEKKDDSIFNNLNINNLYNSRINTLNNNNEMEQKKIISWKKKIVKEKNKNINSASACITDRKKTEVNASDSNSKERNNFVPKNEFNWTWSRFPKKAMDSSFEHHNFCEKKNPEIILSCKNNKKILTKINSKNNNLLDKDLYNDNKVDATPQRITINRRLINNKHKNIKANYGSNNVSMKNIINIKQKNKKEENRKTYIKDKIMYYSESSKKINFHNNLHEGDIYVHKKRNSVYGLDGNYNSINDNELRKNFNSDNKYNVTINNINNCNYYNLIQGINRPEVKIMNSKINKNF